MNTDDTRPFCIDSRYCFAKSGTRCNVLRVTYTEDLACPFCKCYREVTNGKAYPYDKILGHR